MNDSQFRIGGEDDVEAAATTLARAFANYPWTRWTVAADQHIRRIQEVQAIYLRGVAVPHGLLVVDQQCSAVVAFTEPGADLRVDPQVWEEAGAAGGESVAAATPVELPSARVAGSWRLATIGVEPRSQGSGRGSGLLEFGLRQVNQRVGYRAPVHLETSDERNLRLYQRHGFEAYALTQIPGGPRVWSMQRS